MSSAPQDKAGSLEGDSGAEEARQTSEDPPEVGGQAAGPDIRVRYAGRTAVGLVREHNEDNLVIASLDTDTPSPRGEVCEDMVGPHGILFAVCDGMGGAAAGEVASQMAVDVLLDALRRGGPPTERDILARRLVSAVQEAGKRIYHEAQKERTRRGMGTTATVAVLLDKILFIAEVGDSRAYLLRNGVLKQLTKDQSLVNQLIEAGHLTEEEAEAFEHSNIILQALGTSESVQVDLTFVELRRNDRLLLCSDGLSGLVHDESIREALHEVHDPGECANLLIEYAEGGGGHDNITVIVAQFDGEGLAPASPEDTFGYVQYPLLPDTGRPDILSLEQGLKGGRHADASRRAKIGGRPAQSITSHGKSWPWLLTGLLALGAGASMLILSTSESAQSGARSERPPPAPASQATPALATETRPSEEYDAPVRVRVHTDVEQGTLMVNGEAIGPLLAGESYPLKLRPGAYRFEAEADGNVTAVSVVTVRPDQPMDVYLNLPLGEQVGTKDDNEEAPVTQEQTQASNGPDGTNAQPLADGANPRPKSKAAPSRTAMRSRVLPEQAARAEKSDQRQARADRPRVRLLSGRETASEAKPNPRRPATKDEVAAQAVADTEPSAAGGPRVAIENEPPVLKISRERPKDIAPKPPDIPENPF